MLWWDRKARIAWELDELRRAGYEVDAPNITDDVVTVGIIVDLDGDKHRLEADFGDLYPYFRAEVRAPTLTFDHHQNPFFKNLCLVRRGADAGDVEQSLAALLQEQLPKILATGWAGAARPPESEVEQAEPVTAYFASEVGSAIFFDGAWKLPERFTTGRLTVVRDPESRKRPFRGVVAEVATMANERVLSAPAHLRQTGDRIEGYIVKLAAPILEPDAARLYAALKRTRLRGVHEGKTVVIAVVVPEEHAWRDASGEGWLFLVREGGNQCYFARPARAGENDLRARAPELRALDQKTVAVFGLGCIGAPSAIEFARSGAGALRLADCDTVDAGTTVRWPLGLPTVGHAKTDVIAQFIHTNYPRTKVGRFRGRIGATAGERPALFEMTEGASLVYDAGAEPDLSYFLADLARNRGLPYVGVSGTEGGWGGVVVRLRADGTTGCWYCLQRAREEGTIPAAPAATSSDVQPVGCMDPTFTGAGFDLATVALTGVRIAVATLLEGEGGYPAAPWDVLVIRLRDASGQLLLPQFEGFALPPYPDCPVCHGSGSI
jgi:hypothetical protein